MGDPANLSVYENLDRGKFSTPATNAYFDSKNYNTPATFEILTKLLCSSPLSAPASTLRSPSPRRPSSVPTVVRDAVAASVTALSVLS